MSEAKTAVHPDVRVVSDILPIRARANPDRIALLVDGEHGLSFRDWERRSNAMAHGLLDLGCRRGDRVALMFSNDDLIEYAIAYIAALKVGAGTVHVSDELPGYEIERRFDQCSVAWVIHAPHLTPPPRQHVVSVETLYRSDESPVNVTLVPTDVADIVYTAGTTAGIPKAVIVLHSDHIHGFDPDKHRDYDASRYFLAPFPAGTSSSQNIILFGLTGTPCVVPVSRFEPDFICQLIEKLGVDDMMLTPGMAVDMINSGGGERWDLSSVTSLATGAASMAAPLMERLQTMFPNAALMQFYLSSESIPSMVAMPFDPERPGAVGLPAPGTELIIQDENGTVLPAGEIGQICMRTPGRMRNYERPGPEAPPTFTDGWVRMGDLGYMDDEGYLYFFDRMVDAIECGGKRVSTLVVENVLYQHKDVLEASVVGIPHTELGQVVVAAVVLADGANVREILEFARERLEPYQVPQRILVEKSLPRGLIGKVLKREIRKWFDPKTGEAARREHVERRYW